MDEYNVWKEGDPHLSLSLDDKFKESIVTKFMDDYILSDKAVSDIKGMFEKEVNLGLNTDEVIPPKTSSLPMHVTYITELLNGEEKGEFVIIDLHDHHLLLALVEIDAGSVIKSSKIYYPLSEKTRREPYMMLFEFVCQCLKQFFTKFDLLKKHQTVGFCTNLPYIQLSLDRIIVCYFTVTASDFPLNEYDIRRCFERVLCKHTFKDVQFDIVASMNYNTSTFISACQKFGKVDYLLNLVNDCDIVYSENSENVKKWKGEPKELVIDTEFGNFGGNGSLDFITTELDWALLAEPLSYTKAPTLTRMEKFLSDRYLFELIRRILLELYHHLVYCRQGDIGKLRQIAGVSLSDICYLAKSNNLTHASCLLPGGSIGGTEEDAKIAIYVCKVVLIRAALLTSICLGSLLLRSCKNDCVVAVKCLLMKQHPDYEGYVRNFVSKLAPEKNFKLLHFQDDLCYEGAALVTALISRLKKHKILNMFSKEIKLITKKINQKENIYILK